MKLSAIADALGLELEGDGALEIRGLAGLDDAGPGDLTFATGLRYRRAFEASAGGAYLLPPDFDALGRPCLRSSNPYADFASAIRLLAPPPARPAPGVHETAIVPPDARLGADVSIGAYSVLGPGARVGDRTVIHPHVTLYAGVTIGADCEIHSGACIREGVSLGDRVLVKNGAVVGASGFGHFYRPDGIRELVPHSCPVEVGDDAEIGANTAIDASHPGEARRGHPDSRTRIGRGAKIDNLVQVGHGCVVGDGSTLCAQVGLAGSTGVGRNVTFGGQAASAGHLEVADGTLVGARAALASDTKPGEQLLGTPAMERRAWGRFAMLRKRIPELFRRVRKLEQQMGIESGSRQEE